MDLGDWCRVVLRQVTELVNASLDARSIGSDERELDRALLATFA